MKVPTQADFDAVSSQLSELATEVGSWQEGAAPPEPEPWTMLFGCSAPQGIDNLERNVDVRFAAHRTFDGGFPASFSAHDASVSKGKRFCVVSVKYKGWSNVQGAVDAAVTFGQTWPADTEGVFIINHEPEDNGNPAEFRRFQEAVGPAWRDTVPGVPFGGCLMAWDVDPASGIDVNQWIPAEGAWDFLSWDGYDKQGKSKSIPAIFDRALAVNVDRGLPFAIAEYGTPVDGYRDDFTRAGAEYVAAADGVFCTYWNSSGTGIAYPWKSADFPTVKSVALEHGGSELAAGEPSEARLEVDDAPDKSTRGDY
jgi:hypothetical protein